MRADSKRKIRKKHTRKQARRRKKPPGSDFRRAADRRKTLGLQGATIRGLRRRARGIKDADTRRRFLTVVHWANGWPAQHLAAMLGCVRKTVYDVVGRFKEHGIAGLVDRREDNGERKADEKFLFKLRQAVMKNPQDFGWSRPRWTQELLIETLSREASVRVARATMSRALRAIGARRGRPRPIVLCRWTEERRTRRMAFIHRLIRALPSNEVLVWEDEVDIDLNPKIGHDWMLRGQQKQVLTPGNNEKRYVAGARDALTDELTWVASKRKNSLLFISLLDKLNETHPTARVIHVVLDNGSTHSSQQTMEVLRQNGGRIKLHYLPSYYPDGNPIERLWLDLHEQVTRNHRCATMAALMRRVFGYLTRKNYEAYAVVYGPRRRQKKRAA